MKKGDVFDKISEVNYFQLTDQEKADICGEVMELIYKSVVRSTVQGSKIEIIRRILDATIEDHLKMENYELVQVLTDTRKYLDADRNK